MKHMKFTEAEYILGIQKLRNEVFTEDSKTLCVLGEQKLNAITAFITDEVRNHTQSKRGAYIVERIGGYYKVKLCGSYHFEYNLEEDEILLVKGYDRINVVDELGKPVSHDYDIDMAAVKTLKEIRESRC
jgi:S-methylmethionine-dependent homocysteine/selenocysteine methylase